MAALKAIAVAVLISLAGIGTAAACDGHKGECCAKAGKHKASRVELSTKDKAQMLAAVDALKGMQESPDGRNVRAERLKFQAEAQKAMTEGSAAAKVSKQSGNANVAAGETCDDCGDCKDCSDCDCAGHDSLDGKTAMLKGACPDGKR